MKAEEIQADIDAGFDPKTLKIFYSIADAEQDQFFTTKSQQAQIIENQGLYLAKFKEKFTFTIGESGATDTLVLKVYTKIEKSSSTIDASNQSNADEMEEAQAAPQTSERMLGDSYTFPLKNQLVEFFDQKRLTLKIDGQKFRIAFEGCWLRDSDERKFATLQKRCNYEQ